MEWSEYITTVKAQIRNGKAKMLIEDELKDHFEEQTKAYQEQGLNTMEAEKQAILDMGDPVLVGTELNRVHRPKLEGKVLILVLIFGLFSLLVHYLLGEMLLESEEPDYFLKQLGSTMVGITVMVFIYYLDYTIIGKYPLFLWSGLYLLGIFYTIYGNEHYSTLLYLFHIIYLFVPLFAGVLFQSRKWKWKGLIFSCIIGASPLLLAIYGRNLTAVIHYSIIFLIMLNIAVVKRWFHISRKLGCFIVWAGITGASFLVFLLCYMQRIPLLNDYQIMRLQSIFQGVSDKAMRYTPDLAKKSLESSKLIGKSTEIIQVLPTVESNYILVFIFNMFGILIGAVVVGAILAFIMKAFKIATKQKSFLGYMVGIACALPLLLQSLFYFAANLGLYPIIILTSQQELPFLSGGGTNMVYSYAVVGLLLSIYRNSELVSDRMIKRKRAFGMKRYQ